MAVLKIRDDHGNITEITAFKGNEGKSAYEVALKNGFEGTEQEWLESLKGAGGITQIKPLTFTGAVSANYDGSEPVTVNIPSGGSGGASERWRLLKTVVIPADVATDTSDVTWYSDADNNIIGFLVNTDDNGNSFEIEDFRIFGIAKASDGTDHIRLGETANKYITGYRCSVSKIEPCFYDVSFNRFENTAFPVIGFASQYAQTMTYFSFFANDAGYANSGNTLNGLVDKFDTPLKSIYLSHTFRYFTSGKFYIFAKEKA